MKINWKQTYSAKQVLRLFPGATKRQLQYWAEQKLIPPKIIKRHRVYRTEQVILFGIVEKLRARKVSLNRLRRNMHGGLRNGIIPRLKKALASHDSRSVNRVIIRALPSHVAVFAMQDVLMRIFPPAKPKRKAA